MATGTSSRQRHRLLHAFHDHKHTAGLRGIAFLLTYKEWLKVWRDSGHLDERGRLSGQYCMARLGDVGPYAVGNVRIITVNDNRAEQGLTNETRQKMREAKLGRPLSPEHAANIGAAGVGRKASSAARENISKAKLGSLNPRAKLTEADVMDILASPERAVDLAARYHINPSLITMIRKRQRWAHVKC